MQSLTRRDKGFTLVELLVVILIIGILSAIALPQYFKTVEKSRISEADTVIGNVIGGEQRYYMANNKFTDNWRKLDNTPPAAVIGKINYDYDAIQTKGDDGGFTVQIKLENTHEGVVMAWRDNKTAYPYMLVKSLSFDHQMDKPFCLAKNGSDSGSKKAREICEEYNGELTDLKNPYSVSAYEEVPSITPQAI